MKSTTKPTLPYEIVDEPTNTIIRFTAEWPNGIRVALPAPEPETVSE